MQELAIISREVMYEDITSVITVYICGSHIFEKEAEMVDKSDTPLPHIGNFEFHEGRGINGVIRNRREGIPTE